MPPMDSMSLLSLALSAGDHHGRRRFAHSLLSTFVGSPLGWEPQIIGVDLGARRRRSLFEAVYDAFLQYQVLLFEEQDLPPGKQVEFARHFGEVQVHVMSQYHADDYPELYRLSNLDEHGNPTGKHPDNGTLAWHTDGSWRRRPDRRPCCMPRPCPSAGGETHFCDMYGAYERLSPRWKARIAGLRAVHNLDFSRTRRHAEDPMTDAQRREVPAVDHPDRAHASGDRPRLHLSGRPRGVRRSAWTTRKGAR